MERGKSFRAILQTLMAASRGHDVILWVDSQQEVERLSHAIYMAASYYLNIPKPKQGILQLPNKKFIYVRSIRLHTRINCKEHIEVFDTEEYYETQKGLTYKREFPTGSAAPLRVDTVSFDEANRAEIVEYFKERIAEHKGVIASLRCAVEKAEEEADECKSSYQLEEELKRKDTIIAYLEGRLCDL